jgi:hypothetical protein
MRGIFIKVRSSNTKVLAVLVNPFPQSLGPSLAVHTYEIDRKPVAIAAAKTSTMV